MVEKILAQIYFSFGDSFISDPIFQEESATSVCNYFYKVEEVAVPHNMHIEIEIWYIYCYPILGSKSKTGYYNLMGRLLPTCLDRQSI